MKTNLTLIALLLFCGCATKPLTPEEVAYRTIGTIAHTVDGAMKGWGTYVAEGKATIEQEAQVKEAHDTYRSMMRIAHSVLLSMGSQPEGQNMVATAIEAAQNAADEIITLVIRFAFKKEITK